MRIVQLFGSQLARDVVAGAMTEENPMACMMDMTENTMPTAAVDCVLIFPTK